MEGGFLMELANDLTALISTVGFPIVAFGAMLYMYYKQGQERTAESKGWQEAINNNTKALDLLRDTLVRKDD